jgi:pimeloyl-ACP methyl ester carboxylesterase
VGELSLHVVTAGPPDGPPVLLLHGFPECWWGWSRQLGPLVDAGYRVIVPDQRGYGTSDKPERTRDYAMPHLLADVRGLLDAFELERTALVCHDWGGAVGWDFALTHPERLTHFVALNIPHPSVFARELRRWRQLKRSWYILAFQVPWLAERYLSSDGHRKLIGALFHHTRSRPFDDDDLAIYREAFAQPGAVRGMLAWYRAALRHPPARPPHRTVDVPSLLIWGRHDEALGFPMAEPSAERLTDGRLEVIDEAAHFVQHDAPERVNELILEVLAR